jgi:hypothetical protein
MVYCVVPRELEVELFERLTAYYADDPEVTVIVDRREGERRERAPRGEPVPPQRVLRDRRRRRAVGEFPRLHGEGARDSVA